MKITVSQLRKIIREEVENLSEPKVPYWEVVHQTFISLRGPDGKVPLEKLEAKLGGPVKSWNGTGLRVINGVVDELLGPTPLRNQD